MDRLTSMCVFARVLELRSFSGAARELGISQATVSKHVQTLEEWLGLQLLNRTTRRVEPTQDGSAFYARCQRITEEIDDIRTSSARESLNGRIRLGCATGFGGCYLGSALGQLMVDHSGLSIEVVPADLTHASPTHGVDAAIVLDHVSFAGHITRDLATLPLIACASPAYLARRGIPRAPADLVEHDCLIDGGGRSATWRFRVPGPAGDVDTDVDVRCRLASCNLPMLRDAAIGGAGILLTPPNLVLDDLNADRLVAILQDTPPVPVTMRAVYTPERQLSQRLHGALDALSAALSSVVPKQTVAPVGVA
jgi:DNA-binding transcriptional LysR family regulator